MIQNNYNDSSFYKIITNFFIKKFNIFKKTVLNFNLKYPNLSQNIQLTFIYFFAIIDLMAKK